MAKKKKDYEIKLIDCCNLKKITTPNNQSIQIIYYYESIYNENRHYSIIMYTESQKRIKKMEGFIKQDSEYLSGLYLSKMVHKNTATDKLVIGFVGTDFITDHNTIFVNCIDDFQTLEIRKKYILQGACKWVLRILKTTWMDF